MEYYGGDPRIKFVVSPDGSPLEINPYTHYTDESKGVGKEHIINVSNMKRHEIVSLLESKGLKRRIPREPAAPSGPAELQALKGKCYALTLNNYFYSFCPFYNVTQTDVGQRKLYNLGVFDRFKDDNYNVMINVEGTSCGSFDRESEVQFKCGKETKIVSITEPSACKYLVEFEWADMCKDTASQSAESTNTHAEL